MIKKPYTIFNTDNERFLSVLLKHCEETIVDGHRQARGIMIGPLDLILAEIEINVGVKIGLPYVLVFDRKSKQKYIVYIDRNMCRKIYYETKKRKL